MTRGRSGGAYWTRCTGRFDKFAAVGPEHVSIRALARHDGIGNAVSSLWYAVALHENVRLLGDDEARQIPLSQHRMLVHVRDPEQRKQLAPQTIVEDLTVKLLEARIPPRQVAKPGKRLRGRPAMAPAIKAFHELQRLVEQLPRVTPALMRGESHEDGAKVQSQDVEGVRAAVTAWLTALDAQLAVVAADHLDGDSF